MAIFLITVMALIVATIVQLQESSGEMEALDVLSTRAFYAAESGAQAGACTGVEGRSRRMWCGHACGQSPIRGGWFAGLLQNCQL